ncbi:metal ABC transporter solute-binding protein [Agrilactobacillus fermenti]|uniref:metal ABC transporter solute-binding protein n=1 Tax=Agrilactobacillus fermenti TaxID=2586909 RepID=UPI003A5BE645
MSSLRRFLKFSLVAGLMLVVAVVATACGQSNSQASQKNQKISIVTTTDFYGEVAKAVVGNKGTVKSIINKPSVDPHDYEPTTNVAKEVSKADIAIANGIGYDPWMNKLAKNSDKLQYIKVGENIMGKKTGDNPHLWYNPATMPKLANDLAKQLGKKQPKNKAYFKKNAQKYIASLKPVNDEINQLKQKAASAPNKAVYVSEPVFDYAIDAIRFKVGNEKFEQATENESDPSPKVVKEMQDGIKAKKIAFFVYNKQVDSKVVNNFVKLAQDNKVPVLKVTETLPAKMDYKQWMLSQYKDLNQILEQTAAK